MESERRVSDLHGLLVVAFEEGIQLGKVAEVYFDRQKKGIIGFSYKRRLGVGKESFVYAEDIRKLGMDVIVVSSEKCVQPIPETISRNSLKKMKELAVMSSDGSRIGQVSDFIVSIDDDRKISALLLDNKKKLDIEVQDLTLGEDAILVPANYSERIEDMSTEKSGIAKYLTNTEHLSETVKETVQSVGESVKNVTGKMGDTAKETSRKISDGAKVTSEKMGHAVRKTFKKSGPGTEKSEGLKDQNSPASEEAIPPKREN